MLPNTETELNNENIFILVKEPKSKMELVSLLFSKTKPVKLYMKGNLYFCTKDGVQSKILIDEYELLIHYVCIDTNKKVTPDSIDRMDSIIKEYTNRTANCLVVFAPIIGSLNNYL